MTAMSVTDFRSVVTKRLQAYIDAHQNQPGYKAPPPEIIEGMVNLESGFDPDLVDPSSGAIGLGQIIASENGYEWGVYKASHPNAKPEDLKDPATNIDVMIEGLSARQAEGELGRDQGGPGAYEDWFMASAGYLGGADESGFNGLADSYGTTGSSYVRRVRDYIVQTWGEQTAKDIDLLQRGAAVAAGDDWLNGEITYDPNAPEADRPDDLFDKLLGLFDKGLSGAKDAVTDVAGDVLSGLLGFIVTWAPRAGMAIAGIAAVAIGVVVLAKG